MNLFRTLLALSVITIGAGCGTPTGKNNSCDAIPTCQDDETEVDSCDGEEDCREEQLCGETTYCVGDGGGGDGNISAADYDQSCTSPMNCTLINEGDPCDCHVCPDAAINTNAVDAYNDDVASAMCGEVTCPAIGCGEEIIAVCSAAGTCEARQAVYVEADDFDRSCEVASDCVAVYSGEACSECQCPNAAINADAAGAYGAAIAEADCQTADCPCLGAAADCVDNTCVFVN